MSSTVTVGLSVKTRTGRLRGLPRRRLLASVAGACDGSTDLERDALRRLEERAAILAARAFGARGMFK